MKDVDLSSKSLADLKYIAQLMGFSDYSRMKKKELIELISKADEIIIDPSKMISPAQKDIKSDLPSSAAESADPSSETAQQPKKRGRKKKVSEADIKEEPVDAAKEEPLALPGSESVSPSSSETQILSESEKKETVTEQASISETPAAIAMDETANTPSVTLSDPVTENTDNSPVKNSIKEAEFSHKQEKLSKTPESLSSETGRSNENAEDSVSGQPRRRGRPPKKKSEPHKTEQVKETPPAIETVKAPSNPVSETREPTVSKPETSLPANPPKQAPTADFTEKKAPEETTAKKDQNTFVIQTGKHKKPVPDKRPVPVKETPPAVKQEEPEVYDVFEGMLEVLADGYGFLRSAGYLSGSKDVYVAPLIIKRHALKTGDKVLGKCKMQKDNEKFQALFEVLSVNGFDPEVAQKRKPFDTLIPIYPDEKFKLEIAPKELSTRLIDLISPIGKGQRGIIVSPPKAGKTVLLKKIANSITTNYPKVELIVLLIDERPEEVTDMRESIKGDVVSSTFDEVPERHIKVAEMVIERAQRLVEHGKDVVILLDSMTRLARAYNLTIPPTGRTLSGGLDPGALHKPKRFFGSARNIRGGGSLTIVSTALVDTGSKMDEVIYEEFKGTGNMELHLDRRLSEKRIFPAIDINKSGTRKEELLLTPTEMNSMWAIRKAMTNLGTADVTEMIVNKLVQTKTNDDFVRSINTSNFGGKNS